MTVRSLFLSLTLVLAGLAGEGLAHAADAGDTEDVKTLEKQLSDETTALSTSNCADACRALRSIRRAAERICVLEPGPRCDAARAKANDATRRVHDACPDCSLAAEGPTPAPEPRREEAMTKAGTNNAPADAPPSAERGAGGCRSCHTAGGGSSEVDLGLLALGILGVLRIVRRRKSSL